MFRRIFGTDRDNERKNAAETAPAEETSVEETQDGSQAAAPTVETAAQAETPAAEPAPPKTEPLFSRIDEIERTYVRTPAVEPERRSGLRRFFGGEERTAEEIAREERKTEQAVQKTRAGFFGRVSEMFTVDEPLTDDLWEELEELLIMADVGVDTTLDLIERVRRRVERENIRTTNKARAIMKQEMVKLLQPETRGFLKRSSKPYII